MKRAAGFAVVAAALCGIALLAAYWASVATGSQHFFGFQGGGGNGSHYLFWSGVGSDISELTIVAALITLIGTNLRKHNCEVHGCWRMGRHDTAAGHTVCRRHHPDDSLTAQDVIAAHQAALAADAAVVSAAAGLPGGC